MSGTINGTSGNDVLLGTANNDVFLGSPGTDVIDGGAGYDVLRFTGLPSSYFFSGSTYENGRPVFDEVGRLDTGNSADVTSFHNVERLEFLDASVDTSGGSVAAQVNNLYLGLLEREADVPGLSYWAAQAGTIGIAGVASALLNSSEFAAAHEGESTSQLISQFYESVLGRTPSASEIAYWDGLSQQPGGLLATAVGISTSAEAASDPLGLARAGLPTVDLDGTWIGFTYNSLLGRLADLGGFTYFLNAMHNGLDERGLVAAVVNSGEFQAQTAQLSNTDYVNLLYQDVLHRDADAAGRNGHVAALEAGVSREEVAFAFLHSTEAAPYRDAQLYEGNVALPTDHNLL